MPGFNNNMFSLLGLQRGGFARGKGMRGEFNIPAAPPKPSVPAPAPRPAPPRAFSPSP